MSKSIKTNETKTNAVYNFNEYLKHINDVDSKKQLINGTKNNHQMSLLKYANVVVNANSDDYKPIDAYVRFKNNTQIQLQYSKSKNQFVGFNIRICCSEHEKLFAKWFDEKFDSCSDNQRILKSKYIPFDNFNDIVNVLIGLPKYNANKPITTK